MSNTKGNKVKLTPRRLARIIAECACQEMAVQSGGDMAATSSTLPSQGSVDAGLFPGMGDSPALSDNGNTGGCGGEGNMTASSSEPPIDVDRRPETPEQEIVFSDEQEPDSVELVIGSI